MGAGLLTESEYDSTNSSFADMVPFTDKCLKSVDMFLTNRKNVDMFLAAVFTNRQQSVNMFPCTNEGYDLDNM